MVVDFLIIPFAVLKSMTQLWRPVQGCCSTSCTRASQNSFLCGSVSKRRVLTRTPGPQRTLHGDHVDHDVQGHSGSGWYQQQLVQIIKKT